MNLTSSLQGHAAYHWYFIDDTEPVVTFYSKIFQMWFFLMKNYIDGSRGGYKFHQLSVFWP